MNDSLQRAHGALRDTAASLLGEGRTLLVVFDPQSDGVKLPREVADAECLQFGMGVQFCKGLAITDAHIEAVLFFGGTPRRCLVPWAAVRWMHTKPTPQAPGPRLRPELRVVK